MSNLTRILVAAFLISGLFPSVRGEERSYFLSDSQWAHLVAGEVRLLDRTSQQSGGNLYDPLFAASYVGARLADAGLTVETVELVTPYKMAVNAPADTQERLAGMLEFFNRPLGGISIRTQVFTIPVELLEGETLKQAGGKSPFSKVLVGDGELETLTQALSATEGVEILSTPVVITRSAQRANVEVVRELIFASEYDPPEIPEAEKEPDFPVLPAKPSAFESREIGLSCEFLPRLELDGSINLDLSVEDTRFLGFVNYGNPISVPAKGRFGRPKSVQVTENKMEMPVFNRRRFEGSARIQPGGSAIIGGMAHETVEEVEGEREFPLIGKKRTWMDSTKSALFFIVTASVVDGDGKPVKP